MKTINTTLPVYKTIAHQCYERALKGGNNLKVPTISPRHRLPSFQWDAEDDVTGHVVSMEVRDSQTRENVITGWTSTGGTAYNPFVTDGPDILNAVGDFAFDLATSNAITAKAGELFIFVIDVTTTATLDFRCGNGLYCTYNNAHSVTLTTGTYYIPVRCTYDTTNGSILLLDTVGAITFSATILMYREVMDLYFGTLETNIESYTNSAYDTFTSGNRAILESVIKTTAPGVAYAEINGFAAIDATEGDYFRMVCSLILNSGTAPKVVLVDSTGADASNVVTLKSGINYVVVKSTVTDAACELRIRNGDTELTNFRFIATRGIYKLNNHPIEISDDHFQYNGDTLNRLLDSGDYFLRLETAEGYEYWSDWFRVDCVYENLISGWANISYNTFTSSGTTITSAINTGAGTESAQSGTFEIIKDQVIKFITTLNLSSGELPTVAIYSGVNVISNVVQLASGLNEITLTATENSESAFIVIYNTAASNYQTSEAMVIKSYSEKFLTFIFSSSCDLGDIVYEDDFEQTLWLETEVMEPTFPYVEKGQENGDGVFIPTWQRQDKTYNIRTLLIPQYIVDVLHRLKVHETITLTDLLGEVWTVNQIDIEHEWFDNDKYYATATIIADLGEGIVKTGCCS